MAAPILVGDCSENLPLNRVYQGKIILPDFAGRDRAFAKHRTKITEEMRTGPNFAGHYAIVEIGCGSSCRFAFLGDVATGKVHDFPYGGEEYYLLQMSYSVKSNYVEVKWIDGDYCFRDSVHWNGVAFTSSGRSVVGAREMCE